MHDLSLPVHQLHGLPSTRPRLLVAIAAVALILPSLTACGGAQPPRARTTTETRKGTQTTTGTTTKRVTPTHTPADPSFLDRYAATFRFRLGRPRSFTWLPDGSRLLYLRSPSRSFVQRLYVFDPATGKEQVALTAAQLLAGAQETLSAEERARRERQRQAARGITSYRLAKDGRTLLIPLSGRIFLWDRVDRSTRELKLPGKGAVLDPRLSPDGRKVAWVRGGDLWVMAIAPKLGPAVQLTHRPNPSVSFGLAEFVAQEEMGRQRGYWWAPNSEALVFQATDTSGVERMHIHDPLHPERPGRAWPYPRPGKVNAVVRLGVVAVPARATSHPTLRWLDWDRARYPYLTQVRWQKNAPLTVVVESRLQTELAVLAMAAPLRPSKQAPRWRTLLTERDAAWLNLDAQMPRWLPDGRAFLWTTERAGAWQLELRDRDGKRLRALTEPGFGYRRLARAPKKAGEPLWIIASAEPSEQHVFRLAMTAGAKPERLTTAAGWHSAAPAPTGQRWLAQLDPKTGTPSAEIRQIGQKTKLVVPHEAESPGFPVRPRFFTVGPRKVRAAVLLPRGAKPGEKYPVILHVYGGPHYNFVRASRQRWALQQWLADHGFVVCSLDGRGTPYRGRAWERTTKGDLLSAPLADQVEALQHLAKRVPALDLDHVGVFGWSFGGTFSAAAVMRYPKVFQAAVAGAPVTDWRDYDTHYTERYLGLPKSSPKAYTISSPIHFAKQLKRPLMLVHGTADDNVWFSHSVKLSKALFEAGVVHDFVPLPGHTHMVRNAATLKRLYERLIGFFRQHLQARSPSAL